MAIIKEFREFIARGNVIDLAVGVIIGASFGNIVKSLTDDIMMPLIGKVTGGLNNLSFTDYFIPLDGKFGTYASLAEAKAANVGVIAYGSFVTVIIQFLIVAACVFLLVKVINKLKREEAAKPSPAPPKSEVVLEEIRDLLKKDRAV